MRLFFIFILVLFSVSAFSQTDTVWTTKNEKHHAGKIFIDSILYKSFDLKYKEYHYFSPDSTKSIILFESPMIHKDIIREGLGTIPGDDYYRNGEIRTYYPNGNLMEITNYQNGLLHGNFELFYENGNRAVKGKYSSHARMGKWIYLNSTGEIISQKKYTGKMMVCWFYPPLLTSFYFSEGYKPITSEETIQEFIRTYCPLGVCSQTWINL